MVSSVLLIGITGGIGSGKTYVAKIFEQLNVPVIYADNISRELLNNDLNIIRNIKQYFNISDLEKNIKNIKIQIFQNKKHRLFLEKLIHPKVIAQIVECIKDLKNNKINSYCVIEIPMLHNLIAILAELKIDKVIFINCDNDLQISRVMHRDKLSKSQVVSIVKSQFSVRNMQKLADYILDGNDLEELYQQTISLQKKIVLEVVLK